MEWQISIVMGGLNVMAVFGASLAGVTSDRFGRTRTLALASLLFLVGNAMMAVSSGFGLLLLGRALTGIGVGSGLSIDPLYISEVSPPHCRGMMVTASETSINIGILFGFTSSWVPATHTHTHLALPPATRHCSPRRVQSRAGPGQPARSPPNIHRPPR